jgi:hypothetical protein
VHALGDDRTDAFDLGELLDRRVDDPVEVLQLTGDVLRGGSPDVGDAQPDEEATSCCADFCPMRSSVTSRSTSSQ